MGLDIAAYEKLELLDDAEAEGADVAHVYANPDFPAQADGMEDGVYRRCDFPIIRPRRFHSRQSMMSISRLASFGFILVACSSSSSGGSSSGGSSGGSSSSGDGGNHPACSCNITYNGVSHSVDCGGQACINGATFTCSATAESSQGGACTVSSGDGGSSGKDSSASGCSLFTCTNTAGCGGIAPCMSTASGTNYCYEQEGSPDQCSSGTTPTTKTTSNGPTTLCVPAGCPQPDTFVP